MYVSNMFAWTGAQIGAVSTISDQKLLYDCAVARCLWESHWREEWCGVYETGLYSHAPLINEPSLVLCKD